MFKPFRELLIVGFMIADMDGNTTESYTQVTVK